MVGARPLDVGWTVRAAYRYATGRPFTDVVDATFDPEADVFVPEFGDPYVERHDMFEFKRVGSASGRRS